MKNRYESIVLGATYYGMGYASTHSDCLILEESQSVGGDFHHCLHPVRMEGITEQEAGCEIAKIMREFGVWTENGFDLLKAQMVVHEYMARKLEEGMEILLDTRILSAQRDDKGVTVTFITNAGIHSVSADRLVDTTVNCVSAPKKVRCTAKSLNVFTVVMCEDSAQKLQNVCNTCFVLNGPLENEKLIQFCFSADTKLTEAYRQIMEYWRRAFPDREEKILFVAEDFDARYEPVADKPDFWITERFANPVEAFAKGAMTK